MIFKFNEFINESRIIIDRPKDKSKPIKVRYEKNKKGIKKNNFNIFNKNNELNYTEKILPKSNVKCLKLYDFNFEIFKYLKYIDNQKNDVIIDKESMKELDEESYWYASEIIEEYLPDVDYIITPESSSNLNSKFINGVKKNLKSKDIKIIDNFFIKDVYNISYDREIAKKLLDNGEITQQELDDFKYKIKKWKTIDEPLRDLMNKKEKLLNDVQNIPTNKNIERVEIYKEIKKIEEEILNLKRRGRNSSIVNNKVKNWNMKSIPSLYRQLITGIFKINPELSNSIDDFENKKFVIFDDVINTGKTVDESCLILLTVGVKKENILVITLGSMIPNLTKDKHKKNDK